MREIKFRVWNVRRFLKEDEVAFLANGKILFLVKDGDSDAEYREMNFLDVHIMQWTGLTDRNGKEIYEGDILTADFYPFQDEGKHNYHGVIKWIDEEASFYMTKRLANTEKRGMSNGISQPIEQIEEFEVIGNIYENPELINS